MRRTAFVSCMALLGLVAIPLPGQDLFGPPLVQVRVGAEGDGQGGRSGELGFRWQPREAFSLNGQVAYSRLEASGQGANDNGLATLGGAWHRGRGEWGLAWEHSRAEAQFTADRVTFRPVFQGERLRMGLDLSRRFIRFDPFTFDNLLLLVGTDRLRVTGSARCRLEATGLGANLEYGVGAWHFFGSYRHQDYDDPRYETSVDAIRLNGVLVGPAGFRALAGQLATRLERLSSSQLTRGQGLLDSDWTLGFARGFARTQWGLEFTGSRDHFSGNVTEGWALVGTCTFTRRMQLEVRAGQSRSDLMGTTQVLGLGLVIRSYRKLPAELLDWAGLPL